MSRYPATKMLSALFVAGTILFVHEVRAEDDFFSGLEKVRRGLDEVIIEMY